MMSLLKSFVIVTDLHFGVKGVVKKGPYEVGEVLTFDQLTPEQQKKDERINAFAVPILSIPMFGSLNFIELSNGR